MLPVNWLKDSNLHLTLIPPWEASDSKETESRLEELLRDKSSFEIEFYSIEYGADPKEPRLIWLTGGATKDLLSVKDRLESIAPTKISFTPWKPHITIARFDTKRFSSFPIKHLNEQIRWPEIFSSVAIYESILNADGTEYRIVSEYILK